MYDHRIAVPLVVKPPDTTKWQPGPIDGLVSSLDLYPTILDLAGLVAGELTPADGYAGRSLLPLTRGEADAGREAVFLEYGRFAIGNEQTDGFFPIRCVHTADWKLAINLFDTDELYHLAEDIWNKVTARRWGMSITSTDGEFYGEGSYPTAYPEPNVHSVETAVQRGAECVYVRFNEQNMTPLRALEDVNAIHLIACSEVMWQDPRPIDVLWTDWCTRRFGAAAAPAFVSAIKKSKSFILQGLSAGNQPLVDAWFRQAASWTPGRAYRAWDLFARPGERLVDKPWDELVCDEIRPWQVSARGVVLEDFLQGSVQAEDDMREGLREIESVRGDLAEEDYAYLSTCFANAILFIQAVRVTAAAALVASLYAREKSAEHRQRLETACAAMDDCADHIEAEHQTLYPHGYQTIRQAIVGNIRGAYGPPVGLRRIAEEYRRLAAPPTSG